MTAETTRKVSWLLVIGGAVLVLCGISIMAAPAFFLEFLTIWAGAGFIVSGVTGVISYFQLRKMVEGVGWNLFMGILDIVVGIVLIVHPFAFATFIPWVLGIVFVVFGIAQITGFMPFRNLIPEVRIIAVISGVLSVVVGIMFLVWPASLSIWVAAFALVRGITLVAMGFTAR